MKEVGEIIQRLIPDADVMTNDLVVDKRNYYVRFAKIRETLGFAPIHTLAESIREMKEALDTGAVLDYRDRRYNNHHYLSQIVTDVARQARPFEADRVVITIKMEQLMYAACDG